MSLLQRDGKAWRGEYRIGGWHEGRVRDDGLVHGLERPTRCTRQQAQ